MLKNILELHAIFRGKVQGVGFRWTLVDHAENFQLVGTAKNLSNGTVEIVAQASKENLEAFLVAVQQEPGLARIDSIITTYRPAKQLFNDFQIVR